MKLHVKFIYAKYKYLNLKLELFRNVGKKKTTLSQKGYNKVFCIGFEKTGTTSIEVALKNFGFKTGNQPAAEMLAHDYFSGVYERIIAYCHTADAFQDVPFGYQGSIKFWIRLFLRVNLFYLCVTAPNNGLIHW